MVAIERQLSLKQMEPVARRATLAKLDADKTISLEEKEAELVVGEYLTEKFGIYELFIPGDRPIDAKVLSRTFIDRATGNVAKIEIRPTDPLELD